MSNLADSADGDGQRARDAFLPGAGPGPSDDVLLDDELDEPDGRGA